MDECVRNMTLDETIEHAKLVASEQMMRAGKCTQDDKNCDKFSSCLKCAEEHEQLAQWLEELKEYKELEEKLCVMFAGDCSLSDVVENFERQITEPDKDHPVNARILTYEDAEKWNEYQKLEEQGRLLKLPCNIGDTIWWISDEDENGNDRLCARKCEEVISLIGFDRDGDIVVAVGDPGKNPIDKLGSRWAILTKEEAEAKLKELRCNND